ncbi:MAG: PQQ-binding-like beta-propeller repeat protein [Verrucomicrobia bacterium]|nr:PQQ-binding-like beta-propeller repeat protein [Verrucomicrobiota bacterium]
MTSQRLLSKALLPLLLFTLFTAPRSLPAAGEARDTQALLAVLRAAPAGFCVHLGCGDGALTAELCANQRLAVHALEPDGRNVERVRERLQSRGLYGQAAVEQWTAPWLPYADHLVNVLVAENPGEVSEAEMLRIVAPGGALWVKHDGGWRSVQKPWPRAFDEWTHWRHGADGNMVSRDRAVEVPNSLRWVAGPAQDPGGRKWYYDHVLVTSAGRNFYVYEDEIVARDAFNGLLLWRRAAKACTFKETGVPPVPKPVTGSKKSGKPIVLKPGNRTSKVKPVVQGSQLYTAMDGKLVALDAATGETVKTFADLDMPREIAVADNTLLVSDKSGVRAFTTGGKLLWQWTGVARRIVAGDKRVFCLANDDVACLDLANGSQRWRTPHLRVEVATTCSYGCGVLAIECSAWADDGAGSGIVVFAGDTGKVLWTRNYIPGMTHYKEARCFFVNSLLWVEEEVSKKPKVVKVLGLDPQTGAQRKAVGTRGLHCSTPVATERYFIAPEMEFTDWKTGQQTRGRMARHSCRLPFTPANGLLYTFPIQCQCYPILRGYMGLAQTPTARDAGTPRLQPGPACDRATVAAASEKAGDWPMYRHDSYRSGGTPVSLGDGDLKTLWTAQVSAPGGGPLADEWRDDPFVRSVVTAPVCAGGTVLVAVSDRHRVTAFDAGSGAARWSFTAGGRVDTPPSITGDRCVFGAHDGYIYCLDLADGQLVWRFRAAPQETRVAVYGQMESLWPVAGSVLVEDGVAYAAAGRHPSADGGVRVSALRVRDGKLLWEKTVTDLGVANWYSGLLPKTNQKIGYDYEPVDLLARDGDRVAMSRWRFDPKSGAMNLAVASTNYVAFAGLQAPRGAWGYGIRQTKLVLDKPPVVFDAQKLTMGTTNDAAFLLAGPTLVRATTKGVLKAGDQTMQLDAPPVRDGLIAANGRLYVVTQSGKLHCFGKR